MNPDPDLGWIRVPLKQMQIHCTVLYPTGFDVRNVYDTYVMQKWGTMHDAAWPVTGCVPEQYPRDAGTEYLRHIRHSQEQATEQWAS